MREYVPTLYYRLRLLEKDGTSRTVAEKCVFPVEDDEKEYSVKFDESLPHGTYVLTVWGGLKNLDPLNEDRTAISFHPGYDEGTDVYVSNDTLIYDAYHYTYTTELERTKGKLIIEVTDLPQAVCSSEKTVDGLFGTLDCLSFLYSGQTEVETHRDWTSAGEVVTKTLLTPSVHENGSSVHIQFYDEADHSDPPVLLPQNVDVTMRRNELTVLKYVYDGNGDFTVYMLVNDNWEEVHGMIID
ncbi:MAG: hypothetical protein LUC45_00765 [Paraprevotella sp.]|nr:hypothetical protein [Paraprevotella sp.]